MRRNRMQNVLLVCSSVLLGGMLAVGCAASRLASSAHHSIAAVGSDVDQVNAYVKSAESGVKSAAAHADAAGKALLSQVSADHALAIAELDSCKSDIADATTKIEELAGVNASLTAANYTLSHSWGHKLQVFVGAMFTLLAILVAIHLLGILLGIFLPVPYNAIPSTVAKIVNPMGWGTWLVTEFEKKVAVKVAIPTGTAKDPLHTVVLPGNVA